MLGIKLLSCCFAGESSRIAQGVPEQWICEQLHLVISRAVHSLLWCLCWWGHPVHGSPAAAEGQTSDRFLARRREGEVWPTGPQTVHSQSLEASFGSNLSGQSLLRERASPLTVAVMFSLFYVSFQIVKFCQPGLDRVSPVSDVDVGIYQLQRSEKLLGERVEKLGFEADKYINSNMNL